MTSPIKAHVVIGSTPFVSHLTPMRTIAKHLVALGYQVTFITSGCNQPSIEAIGATCFVPPEWKDFEEAHMAKNASKIISTGRVVPGANFMASRWFMNAIPLQLKAVQEILASSQAEDPNKPVVLLNESSFFVSLPILLGAPGLRPKGVIAVGNIPILDINPYTPTPYSGCLPDSSPEGRKRDEASNKKYMDDTAPLRSELNAILRDVGAKEIDEVRQNAVLSRSDIFLQLCPASLEYPRGDFYPRLRFTGGIPRSEKQPVSPSELPDWWGEIVNKGTKRIVSVSQGTIVINPETLIIPTLEALKDREDILVVAALGARGAQLPAEYSIPKNARVADWIPFEELLPLTDVFVSNGGYGSFQTALAHGIPLIIAPPFFADKPDIGARVEWTGTGINLRTGSPTSEALKEAVLEIFRDQKYLRRVLEVKKEIENYDPMAIIAAAIDEIAAKEN